MDERVAWVALAGVDGVGERTFALLLERQGGAAAALAMAARLRGHAGDRALARMVGFRVPTGLADRLRAAAADPTRHERRMRALGGWILTPFDADYPPQLGDLDPPPRVLYGSGDKTALAAPRMVAVVGTRRATTSGRLITARVADRLVEAGVVVVSGLAVGIDGVAHATTLDAGGRTVAVVGGGLSRPGPRAHARLAASISAGRGCVVSELPPDSGPTAGTFPRRNRIISGLAQATVVIEAPARSGALITARHALEQGRTVLVAPGRPFDPVTAGCLALLRETPARPLVGLDELIVDLGLDAPIRGEGAAHRAPAADGQDPGARLDAVAALRLLDGSERLVAGCVVERPMSVDGVVAATGLRPSVVLACLTVLQLRGWVQVSGPLYLAAGPLLRPADRRVA